jgi:hypothetical protein
MGYMVDHNRSQFRLFRVSLADRITLFWGIGLAFHYFGAFHGSGEDLAQQEYDKLKRERGPK